MSDKMREVRDDYAAGRITAYAIMDELEAALAQQGEQEPAAKVVLRPIEPGTYEHGTKKEAVLLRDVPEGTYLFEQPATIPEWELEAKRAFWCGLEIGAAMGAVKIQPRWDEYIAKRKTELAAAPKENNDG